MKFRLLFLCFVLLFSTSSYAQKAFQKKIDSLMLLNEGHKEEDELKLSRYEGLYLNFLRLNKVEEAAQYVDKTVKLAQQLKKWNCIGDAYHAMARYYHGKSSYFNAETYYLKAIEKYTELKDKSAVAGVYMALSDVYVNIPDYAKALDANFKAVALYTELNEIGDVASCYVNISNVYNGLKQHSNAISYLDKALKYFLSSQGNEYGVAVCYANLADIYLKAEEVELKKMGLGKAEKYVKALWCLDEAAKFAEKTDAKAYILANLYQTRGGVYHATGRKDLAHDAYQKSLENHAMYKGTMEHAMALISFAGLYVDEVKFEEADSLLLEAIKIGSKHDILGVQRDAYLMLTTLNEKQNKFGEALKYFKQYMQFKDQIFDQEKEKEITRKQLQLDFSIKEKDYQSKQQLINLALDKQLLLVKRRQQELLLKQQELALSDKEKNIQRLNFLQKQAALENDKLQKENQLKQQKVVTQLQKEQADQRLLIQGNEIKFNRNIAFSLGALAIVLLVAALMVYRAQRKTRKLNQLVSAQKEELESLGKVKDRIFSVVSHDLRTPVNSLISFIDLLENGNVSEEKLKRYAANLKHSLGHTSTMMENLLNWAYSQLQGIRPEVENLMIGDTLSDVVSIMKSDAAQKQITLSYVEKGIVQAIADTNMLVLIVRNLLSNAIKFTPNGGEIKINVYEKAQQAVIEIIDDGMGMDLLQMQSFNEARPQLGATTLGTNKEKGTGLGLSLCKTFAQLMDAALTVSTSEPKGTIFLLVLPKAKKLG